MTTTLSKNLVIIFFPWSDVICGINWNTKTKFQKQNFLLTCKHWVPLRKQDVTMVSSFFEYIEVLVISTMKLVLNYIDMYM